MCYTCRHMESMESISERKRILIQVDFGQKAARDLLGGVLRYAANRNDWDVQIHRGHPKNLIPDALQKWRPQGIITDSQIRQSTVSRMVRNGLKGIVALHDDTSRGVPVHFVGCDNVMIGRAGADLLLSKKLRHFAYVPSIVRDAALDLRQNEFVRHIREKGFDASVYAGKRGVPRRDARESDGEQLSGWLAALPKPCGVMAAFDQRAKNVIDACRRTGIDIPSQLIVLGVDDEEYICTNTSPTLSSILPDFNGGGFRAAAMLDRMMEEDSGGIPPLTLYGIKKIEERTSSMDVGGTMRSVVLACEFMRRNAAEPIRIDDIVAASGTSRRLLEKHFRMVLDTTATHELQRIRLELVKKRLEETDIPLGRIGETCGFNDEFHLKRLFKLTFGMTMGEYRQIGRAHV